MIRFVFVCLLMLCCFSFTACGQYGKLYLPDETAHETQN